MYIKGKRELDTSTQPKARYKVCNSNSFIAIIKLFIVNTVHVISSCISRVAALPCVSNAVIQREIYEFRQESQLKKKKKVNEVPEECAN